MFVITSDSSFLIPSLLQSNVRHHWVHRRKQEGKCHHCGKVLCAFLRNMNKRLSTFLLIIKGLCCESKYYCINSYSFGLETSWNVAHTCVVFVLFCLVFIFSLFACIMYMYLEGFLTPLARVVTWKKDQFALKHETKVRKGICSCRLPSFGATFKIYIVITLVDNKTSPYVFWTNSGFPDSYWILW